MITHFMDLLWEMTIKELKVRYKKTSLGFLWALLYPALQAVIIGYIFQFLSVTHDATYMYSLFLNMLIWNFFSTSLENATPSIVQNRAIIKKAKFSYAIIPISIVLCNGIHFLSSLIIFCVFMMIKTSMMINIWALLASCGLLLVSTIGMSLITSSLHVRSRDIQFLTHAALTIWFYATPLVYAVGQIPFSARYLWLFNPLTEIIMFFQHSIFLSPIEQNYILANSLIITGIVIIGILLFKNQEESFGDYI